jgi:hypothetical protein
MVHVLCHAGFVGSLELFIICNLSGAKWMNCNGNSTNSIAIQANNFHTETIIRLRGPDICSPVPSSKLNRLNHTVGQLLSRNRREVSRCSTYSPSP